MNPYQEGDRVIKKVSGFYVPVGWTGVVRATSYSWIKVEWDDCVGSEKAWFVLDQTYYDFDDLEPLEEEPDADAWADDLVLE